MRLAVGMARRQGLAVQVDRHRRGLRRRAETGDVDRAVGVGLDRQRRNAGRDLAGPRRRADDALAGEVDDQHLLGIVGAHEDAVAAVDGQGPDRTETGDHVEGHAARREDVDRAVGCIGDEHAAVAARDRRARRPRLAVGDRRAVPQAAHGAAACMQHDDAVQGRREQQQLAADQGERLNLGRQPRVGGAQAGPRDEGTGAAVEDEQAVTAAVEQGDRAIGQRRDMAGPGQSAEAAAGLSQQPAAAGQWRQRDAAGVGIDRDALAQQGVDGRVPAVARVEREGARVVRRPRDRWQIGCVHLTTLPRTARRSDARRSSAAHGPPGRHRCRPAGACDRA